MANDAIHDAVRQALINDGWTILAEHVRLELGRYRLFADLSAERTVAAERNGQKILVEIKSFSGRSFIRELQQAMGQYRMYVDAVELSELDYQVHLAVSQETYDDFLSEAEIAQVIQRNQMRLIVVDLDQERVIRWIS